VRPPVASKAVHVDNLPATWPSVGVILTLQHFGKSTMGLSIRPGKSAESRQGSSPDIVIAFPGIKARVVQSIMGLINRVSVQ
jgi:hypothetical protein